MVLRIGGCAVRDNGFTGGIKVAGTVKTFWGGFIAGAVCAAMALNVIGGAAYARGRDKELIEYVERKIEIEALREDYGNRDAVEFLGGVPGVRRAAEGAAAGFDRKLDEILQRFRNRFSD